MVHLRFAVQILRQLYMDLSPPPYLVGLTVAGMIVLLGVYFLVRAGKRQE